MACKLDFPLHGSSLNVVKRCGPRLSDILHHKFGCVATIDGVDFESDASAARQKKPTVVPERRFAVMLDSGVQVSVWKADLTSFHVEAVVNAANSSLKHYGGLAEALSTAGGDRIQKDSDEFIRRNGDLKTGHAVTADPGLLPCKMIIHAVGPELTKYASDVSHAEPLLEKTIRSILDRVEENNLKTVAIPAISSGLFNYPLSRCADTIVSTVKKYYDKSHPRWHLPTEIFLLNKDEPTVREMERACRRILPLQPSQTYSPAAASSTRGAARSSTPAVQIGKVLLTLKRDQIEEQRTDVIVNTASPQKDLSVGQISKALLRKAGYELQHEILSTHYSGHVAITKPYKLRCKEVFHTFCIEKGIDKVHQEYATQLFSNSVLECLWLAVTRKQKSISFPAIGTGALGFSKSEGASIMSEVVLNFARKCSEKLDVYFVILPSDNDTCKAFEEEMRLLQMRVSDPSFALAFEDRDVVSSSRAPTPQISLSGSSDVPTREAERWLSNLLRSSHVDIYNNFILHFSETEYQQLSRLTSKGVSTEEFFTKGHACITVNGDRQEDVVVAALQVEAMLCQIQKQFVSEEESGMYLSDRKVSFERKTVEHSSQEFSDRLSAFKHTELRIVKVDRVENPTLKQLFHLKRNQLRCSTSQTMFQRIPAQFSEMISHIGFHAECAPPEEPAFGEGIYFTATVRKAMEVWKQKDEEYLYFVEAEVLTGKSTRGKAGLILPPAVGTDPHVLFDSVNGGPEVSVIFSGYQALPKYIITCRKT